MRHLLAFLAVVGLLLGAMMFAPPASVAAQSDQSIVLVQGGSFTLTFFRPGDISCTGDLWMDRPTSRKLLSNYRYGAFADIKLGPYPAGTELRFYIEPGDFCARDSQNGNVVPYRYYSDGTSNDTSPGYKEHARLNRLAAIDSYRVDFEDLPTWYDDGKGPDFDFNDISLILRKDGARPDYRQDAPEWVGAPYAGTGGTIGELGSALVTAANVASFHGGVVDPLSLNQCLMQPNIQGFVRPEDDAANCPGPNCMAGAIRWTRIEACMNPLDSEIPLLMRYRGKFSVGQAIIDGKSGLSAVASKATLKSMMDADLSKGWPVVLEVRAPAAPGGVHYVMASAKNGATYTIIDPLCGNWPACTAAKTTLAAYNDELLAIVRFSPGNGAPHTSMIVNAFYPPVDFYVRDPLGRKLGYSARSLMSFVEIPEGGYYRQAPLANMQTNALNGTGMNELYIIDPLEGDYELFVTGEPGQAYNIVVQYHDNAVVPGKDNAATPDTHSQVISGALAGDSSQVRLDVDVAPSQPPVISAPPPADVRPRFLPFVARWLMMEPKK